MQVHYYQLNCSKCFTLLKITKNREWLWGGKVGLVHRYPNMPPFAKSQIRQWWSILNITTICTFCKVQYNMRDEATQCDIIYVNLMFYLYIAILKAKVARKPFILTADITMPHRPFYVALCWRQYRFEKLISEMSLKLGREPVTSCVAGKCVSHSATVSR